MYCKLRTEFFRPVLRPERKACQTVFNCIFTNNMYVSLETISTEKFKSAVPMQIRILTIFAKFSYIQLTFLAKSRIKVPQNTSVPFA